MESRSYTTFYTRYLRVANPHKDGLEETYRVKFFRHTQFYKTAKNKNHILAWAIQKDDDGKYYAFHIVVRGSIHIASGVVQNSKLIKCVKFSKKWKAKDRAYKWYCNAKGIEFKTLHSHALKGRNNFEKVYVCICTSTLKGRFDEGMEYYGQRMGKDKLSVEDRYGIKRAVPFSCFKEKTSQEKI
jgi:hypothetical protein